MPQHKDGLLGDAFMLLLTPEDKLQDVDGCGVDQYENYIEAQRVGRRFGDCTRYQRSCRMSLFQVRKVGHWAITGEIESCNFEPPDSATFETLANIGKITTGSQLFNL